MPVTIHVDHCSEVRVSSCVVRCADDIETDGFTDPSRRPSAATVTLDQRGQGRRTFCSWHQTAWRTLLVREFVSLPEVDDAHVPALPDQLLVLVLTGRKEIESRGGGHWRRSHFLPGRLSMTMPGRETHVRWRCDPDREQRSLHLHLPGQVMADTAEALWGVAGASAAMPDALSVEDAVLEQVVLGVYRAARAGVDDFYAQSAATFLAAHLLSTHGGLGTIPRGGTSTPMVRRAEEFIRDNHHVPISLADIARSACLTPFHFHRVFRSVTGETPHRYLMRVRDEAATRLLSTTNFPIREISGRCGFASASHFTAAFRAAHGRTPSAYRRDLTR